MGKLVVLVGHIALRISRSVDYLYRSRSLHLHSDGVVIAKVDADAHKSLGEKFEVKGFPTIKWFEKGSTTVTDYDGGRTAGDVVEWVNKKTGKAISS